MHAVLFASSVNSGLRHDATGAFVPEAQSWIREDAKEAAAVHEVPDDHLVLVDCVRTTPYKRRQTVLQALHDLGMGAPIDFLAFFSHGWPDGIQFGFNRRNVSDLVNMIGLRYGLPFQCALYTCLTADDGQDDGQEAIGPGTDGGFADTLRDALARQGVLQGHVDAHKTAGHAVWNPNVVRFDLAQGPAVGGEWLVAPGSPHWHRWVTALSKTDLRWRYPLMSREQIEAELTEG